MQAARDLFSYRKHWAHKLGTAPQLPMSRAEMDLLGWDACDVIIVTGDAYVDHPSFGMAIVGRLLEAQGFRVGIIAQPDWQSAEDFKRLGRPTLFFGITAGNMDSMVNRYTADRRLRSDDAYSPGGEGGRRPDRAVIVYAQRAREAYKDVPIVLGGIEASLRRIAHYDYWSDKVRRSILVDAKADILLYGNAERALVELAHRLAKREPIADIRDLRGTAFLSRGLPDGWAELDASRIDEAGPGTASVSHPSAHHDPHRNPYQLASACPTAGDKASRANGDDAQPQLKADSEKYQTSHADEAPVPLQTLPTGQGLDNLAAQKPAVGSRRPDRARTVIRLPSYEQVQADPLLYAQASRLFHLETNPGNARALVQAHGDRDVWLNPPPIPLTSAELDRVYELPYSRRPHDAYGGARIPAWEMIRFSVAIMRGCFGGCTFCSITEHEGRIIQSRSQASILREVEEVRDRTPGFTGVISDLGGPTANMWRLGCRDPVIESACRRLSCVFPDICKNLGTDHNQAHPHRLRPALRPGGALTGLHPGAGDPPRRRLSQDRPGAHRARAPGADDEARHRQLRPLQDPVRPVLPGGGQGAVPDPLLYRRPPRHPRRGHAGPGPLAQAQRLPPRSGPGLPADPHGPGLRHGPHRLKPPETSDPG